MAHQKREVIDLAYFCSIGISRKRVRFIAKRSLGLRVWEFKWFPIQMVPAFCIIAREAFFFFVWKWYTRRPRIPAHWCLDACLWVLEDEWVSLLYYWYAEKDFKSRPERGWHTASHKASLGVLLLFKPIHNGVYCLASWPDIKLLSRPILKRSRIDQIPDIRCIPNSWYIKYWIQHSKLCKKQWTFFLTNVMSKCFIASLVCLPPFIDVQFVYWWV